MAVFQPVDRLLADLIELVVGSLGIMMEQNEPTRIRVTRKPARLSNRAVPPPATHKHLTIDIRRIMDQNVGVGGEGDEFSVRRSWCIGRVELVVSHVDD